MSPKYDKSVEEKRDESAGRDSHHQSGELADTNQHGLTPTPNGLGGESQRNKPANFSAASSCMPWTTCEYVSIVIMMLE
jgi:hypothetical protein